MHITEKRLGSTVVYFQRYFSGMKIPQKLKSQTIHKLFTTCTKLFTNCDNYRIYRFQPVCILKRGQYATM